MRIVTITTDNRVTAVLMDRAEWAVSVRYEELLDRGVSIADAIVELILRDNLLDLPDAKRYTAWLYGCLKYDPATDAEDAPTVQDPMEGFARRSRLSTKPIPARGWKKVRPAPRAWAPISGGAISDYN